MSYGTIARMTEPLLKNKDSFEADPEECEAFVADNEKAVDPPRSISVCIDNQCHVCIAH